MVAPTKSPLHMLLPHLHKLELVVNMQVGQEHMERALCRRYHGCSQNSALHVHHKARHMPISGPANLSSHFIMALCVNPKTTAATAPPTSSNTAYGNMWNTP